MFYHTSQNVITSVLVALRMIEAVARLPKCGHKRKKIRSLNNMFLVWICGLANISNIAKKMKKSVVGKFMSNVYMHLDAASHCTGDKL